jgi:hypothetical protein
MGETSQGSQENNTTLSLLGPHLGLEEIITQMSNCLCIDPSVEEAGAALSAPLERRPVRLPWRG